MTVRIVQGDVFASLAALQAEGVRAQACVTSPPYWGLRSYLPKDHPLKRFELGQEPVLDCLGWATKAPCGECFICRQVAVFRLVRALLADDGVAWVNMGDSYAANRTYQVDGGKQTPGSQPDVGARVPVGLKPKDMCMQPARLALALQADGWYLRQDIIWHKRNPMPESTKDRCTKAHEYLWLLAKSERYYFDQDAIAEPASPDSHARAARGRSNAHKWADGGPGDQTIARVPPSPGRLVKPVGGWAAGPGSHAAIDHAQVKGTRTKLGGNETGEQERILYPGNGVGWGRLDRLNPQVGDRGRGRVHTEIRAPGVNPKAAGDRDTNGRQNASFSAAVSGDLVLMRNKRSVWTLVTEGFSEAHFATFPPALVEPCILASTRPGDTVLDPYGGAGTTGLVADRFGRHALLVELNPESVDIAERRIHRDAPLFAEVQR